MIVCSLFILINIYSFPCHPIFSNRLAAIIKSSAARLSAALATTLNRPLISRLQNIHRLRRRRTEHRSLMTLSSVFRMQLKIHSIFKLSVCNTEICLIFSFILFTGVAFPTGLSAKSKCDRRYDGSYSDTIFWGLSSKEEIARCIKKVGINHRDYVGHTPLHSAVFHPNPKLENIKYFLKQGANINTYRRMLGMKYTPLMTAVGRRSPQSEIVLLLIDHGADLNAKDEKGKTAKQRYEGNNSQVIAALTGIPSTSAYSRFVSTATSRICCSHSLLSTFLDRTG